MHKDYKLRRAGTVERQIKKMRPEKYVDPAALERFRRPAYQLQYQQKYGGKVQAGGRREENKSEQ